MIRRSLVRSLVLALTLFIAPVAASAGYIEIGPIPGLTTAWHPAPTATAVPLGPAHTTLSFRLRVSPGSSISWSGATEISRDEGWSVAQCRLDSTGSHVVRATLVLANGTRLEKSTRVDVVAVAPDEITVSPIRVSVDPVEIDEEHLNASTFRYFRSPSIAALRQVSETWYRTSTNRSIHLSIEVDPPLPGVPTRGPKRRSSGWE